ncbi:MAG: hypothetical protein NVS2B15_08330 [Pseudarthrobacter sp.]
MASIFAPTEAANRWACRSASTDASDPSTPTTNMAPSDAGSAMTFSLRWTRAAVQPAANGKGRVGPKVT